MNIRGKIKSQEEFNYIQNVIRMSGRTEKEFVRAATLTYCDYLLKRAEELRLEAKKKKDAELQGFTDEVDNEIDESSEGAVNEPGSPATDRDTEVQRVDEAADITTLAE